MIVAVALGMVAAPQSVEARSFPARGGSSAYPSDASCWIPNGPSVTNACPSVRAWYIPVPLDSTISWTSVSVTVYAEGASPSNNVLCQVFSVDLAGHILSDSGKFGLTQFGVRRPIFMSTLVPPFGTAEIDCDVFPGGTVHSVLW
jgi:hypothetical protein